MQRQQRADGIASTSSIGTVLRDVGAIQILIGGLMLVPMVVALLYGEWSVALAFLTGAGITVLVGGGLLRTFENAPEPELHHAMVIAAGSWLVTAVLGALPLFFAAHFVPSAVQQSFIPVGAEYAESSLTNFRNPLHAVFESMSGYTTTGLTMSVHEPSVGHGVLFYRSFMQWIGGAGMIVLSLAVLRQPSGASGFSLYRAETRKERLRPSVLSTARVFWAVYVGLTVLVAVYLAVATFVVLPDYGIGATLFDAINHAMTGQSTGGFSTLDDSIAGYDSYLMELVHIPSMVLGATAIPLYYVAVSERDPRAFVRDPQFRTLVTLSAVGVTVLSGLLATTTLAFPTYRGDPFGYLINVFGSQAFREGLFQYISALSTTGWQTSSIGDWAGSAVMFIVLGAMVIGGSAGATVGGIKLVRAYLIQRGIRWEVSRVFLPEHAVLDMRVGDRTLSYETLNDELRAATLFTLAYLLILGVSLIVLLNVMGADFSLADAVFEVATAQGTVGLSSGITGPSMSPVAELLFIVQMWMGRLEIIPVLVLVRTVIAGVRSEP